MSRGAATRENTRRALAEFDLIEPVHVWEKKRCQVHHVTVRKWMRSERRAERLPPPVFEEQVEGKKKEEEHEKEKAPTTDGEPKQGGEVTPMETDGVVENLEHKTEEPEAQRISPVAAPEKPEETTEAALGMDLDEPVEPAEAESEEPEKPLDTPDDVQAEKASESVKSAPLTPVAELSAENATFAPIVSESKAPPRTDPDLMNKEEPILGSDDEKPEEDAAVSQLESQAATPAEPAQESSSKVRFEQQQVGNDAEPMENDDKKGLNGAGETEKVSEDPAETIAGGNSAPLEPAPEAAQDPIPNSAIKGEAEAKEEIAETKEDSKPEDSKGQATDVTGSKIPPADGTESIPHAEQTEVVKTSSPKTRNPNPDAEVESAMTKDQDQDAADVPIVE